MSLVYDAASHSVETDFTGGQDSNSIAAFTYGNR